MDLTKPIAKALLPQPDKSRGTPVTSYSALRLLIDPGSTVMLCYYRSDHGVAEYHGTHDFPLEAAL